MNRMKCRLVMIIVCVALCVLCLAIRTDAKAWLNGHPARLRPDGPVLQTRFYGYIVHTGEIEVRYKKQLLPLSDLQLHDLVTVESDAGRVRFSLILLRSHA